MRKWTQEKVIEAIMQRFQNGSLLNYQAVVKDDEKLCGAARAHFGNWDAAMTAAGFKEADYKNPRPSIQESWDRDKVIQRVIELIDGGKDVSPHAVQLSDGKLYSAAVRNFGSWANLIDQIGLEYDEIRKTLKWDEDLTRELIVNAYRMGADLSDKNVSALNGALYKAGMRKFGSWEAAILAAGIDYSEFKQFKDWSRAKILKLIKLAHKSGVSYNQLKKMHIIDDNRISNYFTNIHEVYEIAGIDPKEYLFTNDGEERISNRIKEIRKDKGLSQLHLVDLTGISEYRIRLIETEIGIPNLNEVLKLSEALNTSVNELFKIDLQK